MPLITRLRQYFDAKDPEGTGAISATDTYLALKQLGIAPQQRHLPRAASCYTGLLSGSQPGAGVSPRDVRAPATAGDGAGVRTGAVAGGGAGGSGTVSGGGGAHLGATSGLSSMVGVGDGSRFATVQVYIYVHVFIYINMYIHIFILYIYIYTYTYIHTYIYICLYICISTYT